MLARGHIQHREGPTGSAKLPGMSETCPHCGFRGAVVAASGTTRCPRCEESLAQATGDGGIPVSAGRDRPPSAAAAPDDTAPDPVAALIGSAEATADPAALNDSARLPASDGERRPGRRKAPSFVRGAANAMPTGPRWPGIVAIAVLLLVLSLQLLLAQRAELAASARWRPLVSSLCGALGCDLPAWREPAAITMIQRSVLPKPGTAGTLVVDASFRNDARWPQPWPALVVVLSDVDGRTVGQRAFQPAEYLGAASTATTLASGQSASAHLEILEPAPGIVAFSFDFR